MILKPTSHHPLRNNQIGDRQFIHDSNEINSSKWVLWSLKSKQLAKDMASITCNCGMNGWMVYHETQTFQSLRRTGIQNKNQNTLN